LLAHAAAGASDLAAHLSGSWRVPGEQEAKDMLSTTDLAFLDGVKKGTTAPGGGQPMDMKRKGNTVNPAFNYCYARLMLLNDTRLPVFDVPGKPYPREPSTRRLHKTLAGRHLCFMGDSVSRDFWLYLRPLASRQGMRTGLPRTKAVRPATKEAAEYMRSKGYTLGQVSQNYISMPGQQYLSAWHSYEFGTSETDMTTLSWFPFYESNFVDLYLADDMKCDILVSNFGAHYNQRPPKDNPFGRPDGELVTWAFENNYEESVSGFLEWAANWTSYRPGRQLIWRETLPQHFRKMDRDLWRAYKLRKGPPTEPDCVPQVRASAYDGTTRLGRGKHNAVVNSVYSKMAAPGCPGWLRTEGGVTAAERFWQKYNWTEQAEMEKQRRGVKVGKVTLMPAWDLWVDHWDLHMDNGDCTHWCYAPTVLDAFYERMTILIEDNDRDKSTCPLTQGPGEKAQQNDAIQRSMIP